MSNRQMIYDALVEHAKGHIKKHAANVEIYMEKAVGVGEHPELSESIETQVSELDDLYGRIDTCDEILNAFEEEGKYE